jgi:type I site-specific restriction-modification system R (restriction) subunit
MMNRTMPAGFTESDTEEAALGWLETLGYTVRHGPDIAYNVDGGERADLGYHDTILQNRLHRALTRLNPALPVTAVSDAYRKLLRVEAPNLLARNRALHRMLVDGVNVEYTRSDGSIAGAQAQVIDFERPEQNEGREELVVEVVAVSDHDVRCRDLLRQEPVKAESRADLRAKLQVGSGGVIFTTIQKFMPEEKGDRHPVLSKRRNIVVIADEAHRSQYDFIDGLARHLHDALPNASFIGFTGTPIEKTDANTRAVFGDYISIYDIQRAVTDGATVPIYYESRLAKLELKPSERPKIDPEFEELTEGEEVERKEKLKTKWAQLEAIVGSENRVKIIARDIVAHFEERLAAMDGKAMIVCMSRRICVDLYRELIALCPEWHEEEDDKGALKVVMTCSAADPADW